MGIKKNGKLIDDCLEKLQEGESFFVLRGQDASAPKLITMWLAENNHLFAKSPEKVQEAVSCINRMIEWGNNGYTKKPD